MCHFRAIRRAARRLHQLYEAHLEPCGLRQTEFSILAELDEHGFVTLAKLGRDFMVDRWTLRYTLEPLIAAKLIRLTEDPEDRRSRRATLTPGGKIKVAEARPLWLLAQRKFEAAIGHEEAEALRATLQIIATPGFENAMATHA